MEVIGVYPERCTGCKTCELYCAAERGSNGKTLFKAVQEQPIPRPRVRVEGADRSSFPLQCRQCLNAPCLDACLSGALTRDPETNIVIIREDRCIACWTCTLFCPYGVIYPWPERKMALKCDRCNYMEYPVCVDVCPTQALALVNIEDYEEILQKKRREISQSAIARKDKGILLLDLTK